MNPAKCKSHSRASRLISRTYVTQKYLQTVSNKIYICQKTQPRHHRKCIMVMIKTDQEPADDWDAPSLCNPRPELELLPERFPCGLCHNLSDILQTTKRYYYTSMQTRLLAAYAWRLVNVMYHSPECLWSSFHSWDVAEFSGAHFLIRSQDRHSLQSTCKVEALVYLESLGFDATCKHLFIWSK